MLYFFPSDCKMFMSIVHVIHLQRNKIGALRRGPYKQQSQIPFNSAFCYPEVFFL